MRIVLHTFVRTVLEAIPNVMHQFSLFNSYILFIETLFAKIIQVQLMGKLLLQILLHILVQVIVMWRRINPKLVRVC